MKRYGAAKGTDALLARLASDPGHFGRRVIFPPYRNKLSHLPPRKEAQQAAALLPLLAKDAFDVVNLTAAEAPARTELNISLGDEPRSNIRPQLPPDHVTAFTT